MKVGLVGPSRPQRSLGFDAQRTINLYPVLDDMGRETSSLQGTPGNTLFCTTGAGSYPIRGMFTASGGRSFAVQGSGLYELNSIGTSTFRGSLLTSSGYVSMDENGTQLMIVDGTYGYIFTYATNTLTQITDADFPTPGSVVFIDGYFVINKINSQSFYISALYDGTSWAALDFASAESSPDNLVKVVNSIGQLWLFGTKTAEIWSNTGAATFPFERISGGKMQVGIMAGNTAVPVDNSVIWVGQDAYGKGIVYRADGFSPMRVSDDAVEYAISQATDSSNMIAYTYQENGHIFYVLTGGGLSTTWVLDLTTKYWHERAYMNAYGFFEPHVGIASTFAFGKQLIGDKTNGNIYVQSLDYYSDNGNPLVARRVYTHLSQENVRSRLNELELVIESGVGLTTGQGSDPVVILRVSKDAGRTWSTEFTASIGKVGEYWKSAKWRRIGVANVVTFEVTISDPVKRSLIGSYLR